MSEANRAADANESLTKTQQQTFAFVLNLIIPPSADGRMPGAAEFDVLTYICDAASHLLPMIRTELDRLEQDAASTYAQPFHRLALEQAQAMVTAIRAAQPEFMRGLAQQTACCYYQQDRVLEAIGLPARSPFPVGFEVKAGDLSLLEPVKRRGRVYREI